jgi:hypothetical protein
MLVQRRASDEMLVADILRFRGQHPFIVEKDNIARRAQVDRGRHQLPQRPGQPGAELAEGHDLPWWRYRGKHAEAIHQDGRLPPVAQGGVAHCASGQAASDNG